MHGMLDRDGNGIISNSDLKETLIALGQEVTTEEVQELINEIDTRNSSEISFKDFHTKLSAKIEDMESIRVHISNVIRTFDLEGKGFVSVENIRTIFVHYFDDVTEKDLERLIKKCPRNEFGDVFYDDLVKLYLYPI